MLQPRCAHKLDNGINPGSELLKSRAIRYVDPTGTTYDKGSEMPVDYRSTALSTASHLSQFCIPKPTQVIGNHSTYRVS